MEFFSKQPSDEFAIEASFKRVLVTGDVIDVSISTVTAYDNDDNDVTADVIVADSLAVSPSADGLVARVKEGEVSKSPYKLTFLMKTTGGDKSELDIGLTVYSE